MPYYMIAASSLTPMQRRQLLGSKLFDIFAGPKHVKFVIPDRVLLAYSSLARGLAATNQLRNFPTLDDASPSAVKQLVRWSVDSCRDASAVPTPIKVKGDVMEVFKAAVAMGMNLTFLGLHAAVRTYICRLELLDIVKLWNTTNTDGSRFITKIIRQEVEAEDWIDTQTFTNKMAAYELAESAGNRQACFVLKTSLGKTDRVENVDVLLIRFGDKNKVTWNAAHATAAALVSFYTPKDGPVCPPVMARTTSAHLVWMLRTEMKRL